MEPRAFMWPEGPQTAGEWVVYVTLVVVLVFVYRRLFKRL